MPISAFQTVGSKAKRLASKLPRIIHVDYRSMTSLHSTNHFFVQSFFIPLMCREINRNQNILLYQTILINKKKFSNQVGFEILFFRFLLHSFFCVLTNKNWNFWKFRIEIWC